MKLILASLILFLSTASYALDRAHPAFDALLRAHVKDGLVDYEALKKDPSRLKAYAADIADVPAVTLAAWPDEDKIAFWINAYNALTLVSIVEKYPVKSIRDIPGVWDSRKFKVAGRSLTINEIEHEILRKDFEEPRIHMALVCAAMSCPPLRDGAYVGSRLDEQLKSQGVRFVGNKENVRLDQKEKTLHLSSIFKWFGEDFEKKYSKGASKKAVVNFVAAHSSTLAAEIENIRNLRLSFIEYDWSLNKIR